MNPDIVGVSLGTWNRLGMRTFWLFLSRKMETASVFLLLAVIFSIARSVSTMPAQVVPFLGLSGVVCFIIFFVAAAIALVSSWLVYDSHEFYLSDDAIKIRHGIFTKQEVAIPYRQIQNVDIERTLMDQILGLSKLVVLTAGHEEEAEKNHAESEGVLPAMDKNLAAALQEELLKRADIQKVVETGPNVGSAAGVPRQQ